MTPRLPLDFRTFSAFITSQCGFSPERLWKMLELWGALNQHDQPLYEVPLESIPPVTTPSQSPASRDTLRRKRHEAEAVRAHWSINLEMLEHYRSHPGGFEGQHNVGPALATVLEALYEQFGGSPSA